MLLAGPAVLAFFSGGYGVQSQQLALSVALVVLAVLAVAAPWPLVGSRLGLVALAALVGLALWTGISIDWGRIRNLAADETAQAALYAAVFAGGLVVMRQPRIRAAAPAALLAGVTVVALYALAGRLLPDLIPTEISLRAGSRLQQPLTYWNALGLLMAFGLLLAAGVASESRHAVRVRALACAAAVPCAVALFLTFSRGSLLALAAGLVALFLARPRRDTFVAGAIVAAGAGLLVVLLQLFPAVLDLGDDEGTQTGQGAIFLVAMVAVAAAVAAGFARYARRRPDAGTIELAPMLRAGLAVGTVAVVLGVGYLIATGSEKTDPLPASNARLTKLSTNRGEYWRVAFDSFAAHPLTGVGAGSYGVEWRRERESDDFAQDAHMLYLETLAELGLVGGLLLAAFLTAVAIGVRRSAADPLDPVAAVAAGCLAAFVVHVGLDWTWEFPAVTMIALLLAAGVVAAPLARADTHA